MTEETLQKGSLLERLARVKKTRWIRFAIVSAIFVAWVAWLGSWWVLVFWLLLADIYLTQFIPYTWWKHTKNATVRSIMAWVDAIVYALILVYFLFLFVGQNYQIPSSSLEKSLLVGDYLWVNKMVYGPRVPNTPLHFPLAQNTLPFFNCKSYIDKPQWDYHRLKGIRSVERGDIVVFNFPAGDTVALKVQNPDYYTLVKIEGRQKLLSNPDIYGDIIYRTVDRRENYVKRCIGLPGETLMIKGDTVIINGKALNVPSQAQFNYLVQTTGRPMTDEDWDEIGVCLDDHGQIDPSTVNMAGALSIGLSANADGTVPPIYQAPLTKEMVQKLKSCNWISRVVRVPVMEAVNPYPITHNYGWTRADYGVPTAKWSTNGVWIPKKGESLKLTLENLPVYERVIKNYEGNDLRVEGGKILVNGEPCQEYTFKMDYYWMMGDNRDNSADSRYWGFVPEDHVVGTPIVVLVSLDKDRGLFNGKIRWNRVFRSANPSKEEL